MKKLFELLSKHGKIYFVIINIILLLSGFILLIYESNLVTFDMNFFAVSLPISLILINFIYFSIDFIRKQIEAKEKNNKAHYDEIRSHLENEIVKLQFQMVNNENNWKEIYHLPLSAQTKSSYDESVKYDNFLKKFGLSNEDLKIDKKMVFLLTPFSNSNLKIYAATKEVCSTCGLQLYRGDEKFSHEDILDNIIRYIVKSRVIIANINGKNPNVFYELGIAHTLGKPTILLSETIESNKTPFDLQQNRIIFYKNIDDLKKQLSNELLKILVDN